MLQQAILLFLCPPTVQGAAPLLLAARLIRSFSTVMEPAFVPSVVQTLPSSNTWHTSHHDEEMQSLVSPWRTKEAMAGTKEARVKASVRGARGPSVLGIDLKLLIFIVPHVMAPLLLWHIDSGFRGFVLKALWQQDKATATDVFATGVFIVSMVTLTVLFTRLYASDPGWISAVFQPKGLMYQSSCPLCGEQPSFRSYHCSATGRCVHKFDHFCWFLSTSIGDLNHRSFWLFSILQLFLICWLGQQVFPMLYHCILFPGGSVYLPGCYTLNPPKVVVIIILCLVVLVAFVFFANLTFLHTYLVCTNQTTVELLKGSALNYLHACYQWYQGPRKVNITIPNIISRHLIRRLPPPMPFSKNLWWNLWVFFVAEKPFDYRYQGFYEAMLSTLTPQAYLLSQHHKPTREGSIVLVDLQDLNQKDRLPLSHAAA